MMNCYRPILSAQRGQGLHKFALCFHWLYYIIIFMKVSDCMYPTVICSYLKYEPWCTFAFQK